MILARLVCLCERWNRDPVFGAVFHFVFSGFGKLLEGEAFPAVVHLRSSIFPLTNYALAWVGP